MEINWKRTGNKEFPEEGQNCLIYFEPIGYCLSKFSWSQYENADGTVCEELGKSSTFSDKSGWLGDEDVLWIPLSELEVSEEYKKTRRASI
jgi:hypothetical protein